MTDFAKPASAKAPAAAKPGPVATNHYKVTGDQTKGGAFPSWQAQNWHAVGMGAGNRKDDTPQLDPTKPKDPATVKNATQGAPSIAQANLTGIHTDTTNAGNGTYHDSTKGTVTQGTWGEAKYGKDGLGADVYSGRAAAGVREQVGVRGSTEKTGKLGTASAKGDAYALAEAGADANVGVGKDGVNANANASVRAGVGATGDADLKTQGLAVKGVTDPLTAGIGTHADAFAGAKAGIGVKAGIGPKFVGVEGKAGAMAGAEGHIDGHANLGPLKGKLGASGIAGIGAEASGGISLEDWKLHVGGHMGAALGLGGSVDFDASLDLKQSAQLLAAGGKQLTPANMAKGASAAMNGGAGMVKGGWDGAKNFLDPEKTGHFSMHGLGVRAGRMGDGVNHAAHDASAWAGGKMHDAKDWAGDKMHQAGDAAKHAVTHPGETLHNAQHWAGDKMHGAKDWAGGQLHNAKGWAGGQLHNAKDWAGDKLHQAGDAAKHAVTHPGETLKGAKKWAGSQVHNAGQALTSAKGWAGDKLQGAKGWAGDKMHGAKDWAGDKLHGAKDWAGDKMHQAGDAAKFAVAHPGQALNNAKGWAGDQVHGAEQSLHNAKDWAGDKLHGAKDAVSGGLSSAYSGVKNNLGQAKSTLTSGAKSAWGSLKSTGSDVGHFFGL